MATTIRFVLVETVLSDASGKPVAGIGGILGAYSAALEARLSDYWAEVSGGEINLVWATDIHQQMPQTLDQWKALTEEQRIEKVREKADIPGGTFALVVANDAGTPLAVTPWGTTPYVHASQLTPATMAHEMGHFFEYRGSAKGGHADVAREFFRDEYGDPTCIMGGEGNKLSFRDPAMPAIAVLPNSRKSGPGMNPALVDQCGWLDAASPLVRTIDPNTLGSALLQPWRGAPRADAVGGASVVAIIDGLDADGGRIYLCVRDQTGWDRSFSRLGGFLSPVLGPAPSQRVFAYLSTSSGDSLLLGWMFAATGSTMSLGRVPLKVTVAALNPEGVTLRLERSPWRGSAVIDGVECDPAARIATARWRGRVDAYVIDLAGHVRFNHFNGHGWEYLPWPVIDGVTCDPQGGIAAVARRDGLVEVYVTDLEGGIQRRQRLDWNWSPAWEPLPGGGLNARSSLAAARVDDAAVLLCGVRGDGQVSRTEVGDAGVLADWDSAPRFQMLSVAAVPDDEYRGRIYGVAVSTFDSSIWATPDIASPDPGTWGAVSGRLSEPRRQLAAGEIEGADDVVIAGTDPLLALMWDGRKWVEEPLGPTRRLPDGGLAVFSREKESFEVGYIDTDGKVNVASWSPRPDFRPAMNQYEAQSTVVLQTGTGHFIRVKSGGGDGVGADGVQIGPWERLRMFLLQTSVINAGETRRMVAFQVEHGQYMGAVGGGGSHVIAQATVIGPWETFYLNVLPGDFGKVTIGCIDESHYWTAPGGGGGSLAADKSDPKDWETFILATIA